MGLLRNPHFAAIVMAMLVLCGTLVGGHNTLAGMRREAADIFTSGVRGDGIGIQGDLNERASIAYNMVVVARRYLPEENRLIQDVLAAREALQAAATVGEKAVADRILERALIDLYDVLNAMSLSTQDARFPQRLYTDFRSRGDTISHDPYNAEAAKFNRVLAGFPAGLLAGITGVAPLALFD